MTSMGLQTLNKTERIVFDIEKGAAHVAFTGNLAT